jgi:hypothetical protein
MLEYKDKECEDIEGRLEQALTRWKQVIHYTTIHYTTIQYL